MMTFPIRCKLSQFAIQDVLLKTKLTSMVNTLGLTDSTLLQDITITAGTAGAMIDLNLFRAVYVVLNSYHVQY